MPKQPTLGGLPVTRGDETPSRMAILIWGPAQVGKTTLAATAPGDKLWLSLGDNEHVSVQNRKDVQIVKLYDLGLSDLFRRAQSDDPFGLDEYLADNNHIGTVVIDSLTALTYRALQRAVSEGVGAGDKFKPSMENPGIAAYGGRNAIVLQVITGVLRVTAKHGVHCIMTAHEDDPTYVEGTKESIIAYVSIMLGGKLVNGVTFRLSEIWFMSEDVVNTRKIAVRPTRKRRPVKTRMFRNDQHTEFTLKYDANKPDKGQMTINSWFDQWASNGYLRIPVPSDKIDSSSTSKVNAFVSSLGRKGK